MAQNTEQSSVKLEASGPSSTFKYTFVGFQNDRRPGKAS